MMDIAAVLLTLSAIFGWLNDKFLPLSRSVGLLLMSVITSLAIIGVDALVPRLMLLEQLSNELQQIDFAAVVVNGMLAFLLALVLYSHHHKFDEAPVSHQSRTKVVGCRSLGTVGSGRISIAGTSIFSVKKS